MQHTLAERIVIYVVPGGHYLTFGGKECVLGYFYTHVSVYLYYCKCF